MRQDRGDCITNRIKNIRKTFLLFRRKATKNMVSYISMLRTPDSNTYTNKVTVAENTDDVAHTVMTAMTAIDLDAHSPKGQIKIIEDDNQVIGCHRVRTDRSIDTRTTAVHKGLRLQYQCFLSGNATNPIDSLKTFFFQTDMVQFRKPFCGHKADIMTGPGVFDTGIPETNNKLHEKTRLLLFSSFRLITLRRFSFVPDNGDNGEVDIKNKVSTCWSFNIFDVQGVADFQCGNIDIDAVRNFSRQTHDFQLMTDQFAESRPSSHQQRYRQCGPGP